MEQFPEFVTEKRDDPPSRRPSLAAQTGWEAVVFQVEDDPEPESAFSTAAAAP
jgi:hypothetical protein